MSGEYRSDPRHSENLVPGWQDYVRAEAFLPWNAARLVARMTVDPKWIDGGDAFWYRVHTADGHEFIRVDPAVGLRAPAFDHVRLAASLSTATGRPIVHTALPFEAIEFAKDDAALRFTVDDETWTCDLETYALTSEEAEAGLSLLELASPDGERVAYARDSDLWVRNGDNRIRLTRDGSTDYSYATPLLSPLLEAGLAEASYRQFPIDELFPAAIWSPDGSKILTHRLDERTTGDYHLVQSAPLDGSVRPRHFAFTYALPGDEDVPAAELKIVDVEARSVIDVDVPPLNVLFVGSPLKRVKGEMRGEYAWWSDDSQHVYVLRQERGSFSIALYEIDAATGESSTLVEETSETPIDPHLSSAGSPNVRVIDDGASVIWFSQRDGWGHLYLYDVVSGDLQRQITSGAWAVADIAHVDAEGRMVYFTAVGRDAGRDPYMEHLYRVSLDGGEPELLTPEDADHKVRFSPSGRYFVDTCSRVDVPPITVLRSAAGDLICDLERAETDRLAALGWSAPERCRAKARDGVTDVYGVIIKPTTFDPSRSYPVLDSIYGGPQTNYAPVSFADVSRDPSGRNFWHAQALAELGFVVVMIDGMGMPYRSKAYHDVSYRNLGDAGLPDHISALRQVAAQWPYLDLDRVGIYGHSGGGYASCRAMFAHPDFFKVAVSSAGNHVDAVYSAGWTERYMGYPPGETYQTHSNAHPDNVARLAGNLLLVHGEMDENVHLVSTLLVADALIEANKEFDLLVMPNRTHALANDPYFTRKRWDYFVQHLHGVAPPSGYRIEPGPEEPAVDWHALQSSLA